MSAVILSTSQIFLTFLLATSCWQNASARQSRRFPAYQGTEVDVLNGVDSGDYDAVYVHYHGCVWSEFGDGYGCGDQGGGNGDAGGDNDSPWYLGRTQCYRANVAYSLYGIRSDDKKKKHPDNICKRRRYFINSFFTTNGVDDFGDVLGLANGADATSYCTVEENNDDGQNNENDESQQMEHGSTINANAHSYTTYCDTRGKFVTAMFDGASCSDKRDVLRTDALTALNNELDNVGCLLVYSKDKNDAEQDAGQEENNQQDQAAEGDGNNNENGNEGGRKLADRKLEERNDGLVGLLSYSNVCSLVEYSHRCPDPHGAKKRLDLNATKSNGFWKQFMWLDWLTIACFFLSIVFLAMAFCVYKDRRRRARRLASKHSSQRRGTSRGRSVSREHNGSNHTSNRDSSNSVSSTDQNDDTQPKKKGLFQGLFSKKNNGRS
ncbi:hypothetical protein IV203_025695 [Nitzschia inconspicua]|uniref:Uncharacterized protein n=1 Tax=Nitzschia inconspicua TaxID=303405 RepID=A0A9K3LGK5_9STRA|nr:hypothetical protein IV203_025695 [Nitzschia inconspicua]